MSVPAAVAIVSVPCLFFDAILHLYLLLIQDQFEQHVDEHVQLQIFTYYGSNRTSNVKQLAENDVVLTTYQTLAADSKVCLLRYAVVALSAGFVLMLSG